MWAIRILSGAQQGQVFPLQPGKNSLGRAPTCTVRLASQGISKEHAQIYVTEDKVIISDMNSRNGTFVNGVRIQNQKLQVGDKVAMHDVLFDVLDLPNTVVFPHPQAHSQAHDPHAAPYPGPRPGPHPGTYPGAGQTHASWQGNLAVNPEWNGSPVHAEAHHGLHMGAAAPHAEAAPMPQGFGNILRELWKSFQVYIDEVAMPGVYHLAQLTEYRMVIGLIVALYVVMVTTVATFPMVRTIKSSIQEESKRRAASMARTLAQMNRQFIIEKNEISVSTRMVEVEEGVTAAFIISSKDGHVIAPANLRGNYVDKPFVNKARRSNKDEVELINDSTVGASSPINYYNSELGSQAVAAHAVVIYDIGDVALKGSQTITMFMQTLLIGGTLGFLLYFFLFKIVTHPIASLNAQLDDALRDGRDNLSTSYHWPVLFMLTSNINSALSRIGRSSSDAPMPVSLLQREKEAENLVEMFSFAAIAVSAVDEKVIACNAQFDRLVGGNVNLRGRPLSDIPDSALQQNISDLLPRLRSASDQIARNEIPFFGETYEVSGQAVMGSSEPMYFLVSLKRIEVEGS